MTKYFTEKKATYFSVSSTTPIASSKKTTRQALNDFSDAVHAYSAKREVRTNVVRKRYVAKSD